MIKLSLCNYIAGGGKDSVAKYLVENHGFKAYSFSQGIYEIKEKYFMISEKERPLLHHIGEKLREYDVMLWIKYALHQIEEDGHDRVIITDTRKLLEYSYLEEIGWNNLMVYCDPKVAIKRIIERDGKVDEDLVMNSQLENQLRPLMNNIRTIDNSGNFEETKKELDAYIRFLESKEID